MHRNDGFHDLWCIKSVCQSLYLGQSGTDYMFKVAVKTRKMCTSTDLQTHAGDTPDNCVTLTFNLRVSECRGPALSSKFGVDSSSRFPFSSWTDRQTKKVTDATDNPAHVSAIVDMGNNVCHLCIQTLAFRLSQSVVFLVNFSIKFQSIYLG